MRLFPCFRGFSTFHALAAAAVSLYLLVLSDLFSEDARGTAIVVDRKSWLSDGMFGVSLLCTQNTYTNVIFSMETKMQDQGVSQNICSEMRVRCSVQPNDVCFVLPILGLSWLLLDRLGDDPVVFPSPRRKGICKEFYLLYHHTYSN